MSDIRVSYEELKLFLKNIAKTSDMKLVQNEKTSAQVKLFCLSIAHHEGKGHMPLE